MGGLLIDEEERSAGQGDIGKGSEIPKKVPTLMTEIRIVVNRGVFWGAGNVLCLGLGSSYTGVCRS